MKPLSWQLASWLVLPDLAYLYSKHCTCSSEAFTFKRALCHKDDSHSILFILQLF